MNFPTTETFANVLTIIFALLGSITAAFWLSLIIWAFRDMRRRSRDPFAQILTALLVATIPNVGILIYLILRPPETLAERYERALEEEALLQEIEERPRCHKCDRVAQPKWAICPTCHTELKKQCPRCFMLLELVWTRCPRCTEIQSKERPQLKAEMLMKSIMPPAPSMMIAAPQPRLIQPAQTEHTRPAPIFRQRPSTQIYNDDGELTQHTQPTPAVQPLTQPQPNGATYNNNGYDQDDDNPTVVTRTIVDPPPTTNTKSKSKKSKNLIKAKQPKAQKEEASPPADSDS